LPPIINSSTQGRTVLFVTRPPTGALLAFIGFAMVLRNWASVLVISLPIALAFLYRINVEERAPVQALGERYRSYIKRTKRLIPFCLLGTQAASPCFGPTSTQAFFSKPKRSSCYAHSIGVLDLRHLRSTVYRQRRCGYDFR
jgi:hypothetical protein